MIDLGHWFKESYKVPSKEEVKELDESENEIQSESDNGDDQQSDY
jgi:endogenous inhibitor of DNA gyrase (YacG/DUF329 family)